MLKLPLLKLFSCYFFLNGWAYAMTNDLMELPSYVVVNNPQETRGKILRTPAQSLTFPLSEDDKRDILILEKKFDQEKDCAGLAAPQIGISKQIIVFAVPDEPELKKWRPDLIQTMPKTVWINPVFEPIGDEKHSDYEGCFSVKDLAGPVARATKIRYSAYTPEGTFVTGEATGFLARVIQHEIEHVKGTIFIDHVPENQLLSIEEYRKKREKEVEKSSNS